ncbi:MAG: F0F1 ATP synthase subunit B [Phycisphaerae bacterium]|nr:F0F1 ATP synthase subunit B [Phycisphaerae bacterium]
MRYPVDRTTRWVATVLCVCVVLCATRAVWAGGGKEFYPGDLGQAIAAILIFGVLLFVLGKWAWGPIVRQLQDREQDIISTIENTQRQQREARELLEQYQGKIENADTEAEEILARSVENAGVESEKIIEAARQEARESVKRGLVEIKHAKRQAIRDMRDATAELATEIAGCIIDDSLTPQVHNHLVDASIKAIGQRAAEES